MRPGCLLLCCLLIVTLHAQENPPPSLYIGDPAPSLQLREWLKGEPVERFEKGRVYVLEFWATWCAPCRAAMPHLSALAEKYKGKVSILGIDVYELSTTAPRKIKAFVDSMGNKMNYAVAAEESNLMATCWLMAFDATAIPHTFVVNAEGKIAWIGHPMYLDKVLPGILDNTWDIEKASAKRKADRYLDSLDATVYWELFDFRDNNQNPLGLPNLALWRIDEMVKQEPKLKYAPHMAYHTFASLLKTNPAKAYEYAKEAMQETDYTEPALGAIVNVITTYTDRLTIPPEIYRLGADAYQVLLAQVPYPEIVDMHKYYSKMADWYSRAGDKSKAIAAQQQAIDALRNKK